MAEKYLLCDDIFCCFLILLLVHYCHFLCICVNAFALSRSMKMFAFVSICSLCGSYSASRFNYLLLLVKVLRFINCHLSLCMHVAASSTALSGGGSLG